MVCLFCVYRTLHCSNFTWFSAWVTERMKFVTDVCAVLKNSCMLLFVFCFKFQVTPNLNPCACTLRHQLLSWQWMGGCWHGDRCDSHSLLHNYFLCSWIRFHFKHPPPPAWQVWRHRWLSRPRHSLNIDRTSTQIKTRALCKRLQAHRSSFFFLKEQEATPLLYKTRWSTVYYLSLDIVMTHTQTFIWNKNSSSS